MLYALQNCIFHDVSFFAEQMNFYGFIKIDVWLRFIHIFIELFFPSIFQIGCKEFIFIYFDWQLKIISYFFLLLQRINVTVLSVVNDLSIREILTNAWLLLLYVHKISFNRFKPCSCSGKNGCRENAILDLRSAARVFVCVCFLASIHIQFVSMRHSRCFYSIWILFIIINFSL